MSFDYDLDAIKEQSESEYRRIEKYFRKKKFVLETNTRLSLDEILSNAPAHYPLIKFIEQINSYIANDPDWLKNFVESRHINFDWEQYSLWRTSKDYLKRKYNDTLAPTKWIYLIEQKIVDILKMLQILVYMEFYITDEDFKEFLKKNPSIDFKLKANYVKKSPPSEDIEKIFKVIDYLIDVDLKNDLSSQYAVDTVLCMKVYRFIDETKIFDLLKRKEFFIKYRLMFLQKVSQKSRLILPHEEDILHVAEEYVKSYRDLVFTYGEFKERLVSKFSKVKTNLY